ncbi:Cadherin-related tumor suppressor [Oopsacas minuta]|uniref:Cadherin-related tumor suppressor n=1 Tax=Oopsacas minuta TaxID=111878 RepID=A0AAV7K699_9METZ|nr:Cadherin-related tumor suppressor [Oopsacas minuta]
MIHTSYSIFLIIIVFTCEVLTVFTPIPPIVFSPADYTFLVPEHTSVGEIIGNLNPITNEVGIILTPSVIGTNMFSIDTNYNVVTAIDAPDYETLTSVPIHFQISTTYTFQTHDYVATTNITIFITDINDNIPMLSSSSYSFTFTEDQTADSLIGFVSAVDIDGNPYNCISYSITPPGNGTSPISVTEEGGITTSTTFTPGVTMYEVVATDSGVPPQSANATIEITVIAARTPDEPEDPIFQQTEYHFLLREDVALHTEIGFVAANRNTSIVATSSFLYSVPQPEMVFQIDASTGEVSNQASPFDFDSGTTNYSFSVTVKLSINGSIEVQSKDESSATVYLRNVNEHSPVIAIDPFSITVSADVPVGSAVGRLPSVTDLDGQDDFTYSIVTASPFSIDTAGFIYLNTTLNTTISEYSLTYEVADKPLLDVTQTTTGTINILVTPASMPPEKSLPTRNVVYTHTCATIDSHSFAFTWLPPTDNSNPTQFELIVTCTLSATNELVNSVIVSESAATVVVDATFDRFTQCEYLLTPYPEGPPVSNPMDQLSFNNIAVAEYSIEVTNQSLIFIQITNITMCLSDIHGNEPLFNTSIILSDASSQLRQFDGSYSNYYNLKLKH